MSLHLSRYHYKFLLHLISHFLMCSISFILFLPSVILSAALSPTAVKQMPLFIPPLGDTNTSFPVAWHRGNHKLGQMEV